MVGDFFSKESGILLIGSVYLHVCKLPQTANGLQVSKAEQISKCEAKAGPACWLCARHAPVYSFICLCLCHFGQHRQNLPCHLQFCLTFLQLRVCFFLCSIYFAVAQKPEWFWTGWFLQRRFDILMNSLWILMGIDGHPTRSARSWRT